MAWLAYATTAVAIISGLIAFFFAKGGERNKVGGIGWVAAGLLVLAGGFALYQTHVTQQKAAEAQAEAVAAANRQRAEQRTMLGNFDFARPFETASFYFETEGGSGPVAPSIDGFIGPFPELGDGATGTFMINVPDAFYYEFALRPVARGGLSFSNATRRGISYFLRRSPSGPVFSTPEGRVSDGQGLGDGQWAAVPEDDKLNYHMGLVSRASLRTIVAGLARTSSYGRLTLRLPGVPEAEKARIAAAYQGIKPNFVIYAPFASGTPGVEDCVSRIRVPMRMRRVTSAQADELILELSGAPEGFDTEPCRDAYQP